MCAYADHLRNEPYVLAVQRGISVDQPWPSKTTLQPVDRDQQLLPIQSFDQTIYRNFWTRGSDFKISVDNFLYFNNGVEQREALLHYLAVGTGPGSRWRRAVHLNNSRCALLAVGVQS
jgi:hypothetical protein